MTNFESVRKFMETFGQEVKKKAEFPNDKITSLRHDLIKEELEELREAIEKKDIKEVPTGSDDYWVAQLCPVNGCNDDGDNLLRVFAVETVCTFMFVTFVLVIAKHNGAADTPINTMAIGLALYCAVREASGISGGCINPAVGLVQTVFQRLFNGHAYPNAPPQQLMYMPIYLISPFIGGMVAGFFQRVFVGIAYDRAEKAAANAAE